MNKDLLHAYVVIKPWHDQDKLFAYVVLSHNFPKKEFAHFLKQELRKEQMPMIVVLRTFPILIPSEKIDRQALISRVDHPHEFLFNQGVRQDDCLSQLWCKVLGLEEADEAQDFILSGGQSIQLKQLHELIQQNITRNYPFQSLMTLPTMTLSAIRQDLTNKHIIDDPNYALIKPLCDINLRNKNMFCLPPLLGEGYFTYSNLAKSFMAKYKEYNLYGLSDPSLQDTQYLPHSLETTAARYVRTIQQKQAHGPYHLFGFSFGCTMAYYVAKALLEQNETVQEVWLIDGYSPSAYQQLSRKNHCKMLLELTRFIIKLLNGRFYAENLIMPDNSKLNLLASLEPREQIQSLFESLNHDLHHQQSHCLLALAQRHLLLLLEENDIVKIPVQAYLFVSSPWQGYTSLIAETLSTKWRYGHGLETASIYNNTQFSLWNNYFDAINLSGENSKTSHLELLEKQISLNTSAHVFWNKKFALFYDLIFPHIGPFAFYTLQSINESLSKTDCYSLTSQQLNTIKKHLETNFLITNLVIKPLFNRFINYHYNGDQILSQYYYLSFHLSCHQQERWIEYLNQNKITFFSNTQHKMCTDRLKDIKKKSEDLTLNIGFEPLFHIQITFKIGFSFKNYASLLSEEILLKILSNHQHVKFHLNRHSLSLSVQDKTYKKALKKISHPLNQWIFYTAPCVLNQSNASSLVKIHQQKKEKSRFIQHDMKMDDTPKTYQPLNDKIIQPKIKWQYPPFIIRTVHPMIDPNDEHNASDDLYKYTFF